MKIRLLIACAAALLSACTVTKTAQDAKEYIRGACPPYSLTFKGNTLRIAGLTHIATVNLENIEKVSGRRDDNGNYNVGISCRRSDNPFAPEDPVACVSLGNGETSQYYRFVCPSKSYRDTAKAIRFLVKEHNPDVNLDLELKPFWQ